MADRKDGRLPLAVSLVNAGNLASGRRIAREILSEDPQNRQAVEIIISAAFKEGKFEEALDNARNLITWKPLDPAANIAWISALVRAGKRCEAQAAIETFQSACPTDVQGHVLMATLYHARSGDPEIARKHINALKAHTDDIFLDRLDSIGETRSGHYLGAQRAAANVLKKDPEDITGLILMAFSSFRLCKPATSRKFATRALRINPSLNSMRILKFLSWPLYFPPVYLAHLLISVLLHILNRTPLAFAGIIGFATAIFAGLPYIYLVEAIADHGIPFFREIMYLPVLGWLVLNVTLVPYISRFDGLRMRPVKLKDY